MDLLKLKDKYLNTLYLKSHRDYIKGYSEENLRKLLNISNEQSENIKNFLRGKGLIQKMRHFDDKEIVLSVEGLEYCLAQRESKIFKVIRFTHSQYLAPTSRASIDFAYYYHVYDENGKTDEPKTIIVSISDVLSAMWGLELKDLEKVLLQFAKDRITEKLKDDTLNDFEEIILLSNNAPNRNPYNLKDLIDTSEAEFEVEVAEKSLGEKISENKLSASIIQMRDIINAIFYNKHGVKLLLLNEERNLLDFFRTASSEEEFSHRISSLGEVSRNLNVDILKKLTGINDSTVRSVQLLNNLLIQVNKENKEIIDTLKSFGRIRQGYPNHTDLAGVIEGLRFFNINYPINNYEATWEILLNCYLKCLTDLYKIFSEIYLSK